MKKITFILMLFLTGLFSGYGQVQVGFGNNVEQWLPFNPYNNYSYSQSIYLASEINAPGTITSIQWYYAGTGALTNSQQLVIYFGTTTKNAFTSTTDWEPVSNLTVVYTGGLTTDAAPGWKTITLTTPFVYDGTSNLIVAVDENKENGDAFEDKFYNSAVTATRSLAKIAFSPDIDPTSPPEGNLKSFIPNIIFGGISQACETPYYVTASDATATTATVSWQASASAPSGGSDYYVSASSTYPTSTTVPTGSVASGTTANMTNLLPATTYYVWVRNNCGNNVYSSWSDYATFVTGCVPVTTFNQNFDSTTVPDLPTCWGKILRGDQISPAANVQTGDYNAYSPQNALVMGNYASEGEYDIIAVSPEVSNLSSATHRLRFYAKGAGSLEIGTLSDNTNTATFELVGNVNDLTTNYTEYIVDFNAYAGTDTYIGIRMNAPQQSSIFIDNVIWEAIPTCPNVTQVSVQSVTSDTATIGWSDGGSETSWDIAVGLATVTDPSTLPFENTDISGTYTATNLLASTNYKVWVRSVCGTDTGVWVGPALFTTDCNPVAGFSENFDTTTVPALPSCWSKIIRANTGVITAGTKIETSTIQIKSLPNSVWLKNNGSTGNIDIILVSPRVSTLSLGTYRLKFYAKFASNVQIGTLDSNTDAGVFHPVTTVTTINGLAEYIVNFSDYPTTTDQYIGFRMVTPAGLYEGITLDNIVWEPIPLCPEVTAINVPEVTSTTATVNWTSTPTETSWEVAVGGLSVTDPNTLTPLPATSPELTVSDLLPSTTYNVWVRAVCGGTAGNGDWVGPVTFTTECPPVASFSQNFDSTTTPNLPLCWSAILRGVGLSQFAFVNTSTGQTFPNFSSPNYVSMNAQGSASTADIILVSPNISTLGQAYRLKFDTYYYGTIEVGTLDGNTNAANFVAFQTITLNGTGGSYVVDFSTFSGSVHANNHIGIRMKIPNPTDLPAFVIDNIVWEALPACPDVTQIAVPGTTASSANITWTAGGTEASWEVAVGAATVTDPNTLTAQPASSTALTVNGLNASTNYKVWVRSVCGGTAGNGAWIGPVLFTTPCTASDLPYMESFNTATTPNLPSCTTALNVNEQFNTLNWETSAANSTAGFTTKMLRCKSAFIDPVDAWFFTRGVNLVQGQNYTISYKKGSNSGFQATYNLKVLYGTNATPAGMTTTLADYEGFTGPGVTHSVNFTVPASGIYYFSFYDYSPNGSGYVYLDDIIVDTALATNQFDKSQFTYYPNPVKDVLNISDIKNITAVSVFNLLGQQVMTRTINGNTAQIDMSHLANGTYMVKVTSDNLINTIKVVKQ